MPAKVARGPAPGRAGASGAQGASQVPQRAIVVAGRKPLAGGTRLDTRREEYVTGQHMACVCK